MRLLAEKAAVRGHTATDLVRCGLEYGVCRTDPVHCATAEAQNCVRMPHRVMAAIIHLIKLI